MARKTEKETVDTAQGTGNPDGRENAGSERAGKNVDTSDIGKSDTGADLGPDEGGGADSGEKSAALENMDELAARFRVPQWQQAALVRFMGWAPGKRVSAQEYETALDALLSRRMGGGRKE